jgi:MFS family permease
VFNALSYLPLIVAVRRVPGTVVEPRNSRGTLRAGVDVVRRVERLRRAFVLAAMINLAAWPVLSVLPAVAQDIESRAHVLGLLVGAFYAGAAVVSWAVRRLRRRFPYGRILFVGFLGAGLLILGHALLTAWRSPGYDAVLVAGLTLVPIGLAVALDSSLLQALVQLSAPAEDQAPVLVVYATVTTVVTPIGGLIIGVLADGVSLWFALAFAGTCLTVLALVLRTRLRVFDDLGVDGSHPAPHGHHVHLIHLFGWDVARAAIADASVPPRRTG